MVGTIYSKSDPFEKKCSLLLLKLYLNRSLCLVRLDYDVLNDTINRTVEPTLGEVKFIGEYFIHWEGFYFVELKIFRLRTPLQSSNYSS